ncbi:MAG TPA: hypothetical protein VHZ09_20500 [Acidobacteriaceae bacterium]|jgi:hypothetical protein|nr:hypothetical protein [Acidobacteriaceae bacterium]
MNPRTATPNPPDTRLTDVTLDAALRDDTILPSSGFAASVMAAVESQSAAPAAIAFPWKRAFPGLVAAAAVLILLLGVLIAAVVRTIHAAPRSAVPVPASPAGISLLDWHIEIQQLLHGAPSSGVFWLVLALALSGLCLLLCRRLVSSN